MGKNKQKTITCLHKEPCDNNNLYAKINLNAMEQAAQDLSAGGFKLWCYFAKNSPTYKNWDLSSKDADNSFGLKSSQYSSAVDELIKKHYLIETPSDSSKLNLWEFYELSQPEDLSEKENSSNKTSEPLLTKSQKPLLTKSQKPSNKTSEGFMQNLQRNIITTKDITKENITKNNCSVEQPSPAQSPQEPIPITQEEFLNQGLARFIVGKAIIDKEGNKIIESCGNIYKITNSYE